MADEILRVDKPQTTDRTGKAIWVQYGGAATSSTFDDEWMLPDDFLAAEQARLTTNEGNILSNTNRIIVLENGLSKSLDDSRNTSYTVTQNADSRIINFGFRNVSGTPTVAVGTGTIGDGSGTGSDTVGDIVKSRAITGDERSIDVSEYSLAGRTLHITITGGTVDVAIFSRENLYEV